MASPQWKVYSKDGEYQACAKQLDQAAVLVAYLGAGATIRSDHSFVIWRESAEAFPAAGNFVQVAEVAGQRHSARLRAAFIRTYGETPEEFEKRRSQSK